MSETKATMTRREAAKALGCHRDTLSRMLNDLLAPAVLDRQGRGGALVLSRPAVEVYKRVMEEQRPLDPQQERARRDRAQADRTEFQLDVEKGEYLRREDVAEAWERAAAAVRTYLLQLPDSATPRLARACVTRGEPGIYEELRSSIYEALGELADPEVGIDCPECGATLMPRHAGDPGDVGICGFPTRSTGEPCRNPAGADGFCHIESHRSEAVAA